MAETADFLSGKSLFITGGAGFLGKVLLEKILWQVPQVRRIILLMRPRSSDDPDVAARLRADRTIFNSSIFDRLRGRHGERFKSFVHEKVKVVAGDLAYPDLGLTADSLRMLGSEVDFIINLAARVSFHERFDHAINSNTLGPCNLLSFAKRFRNPMLLHVSTAYVSGRRTGSIPEHVLEPDVSAFELMGVTNSEPLRVETEIEIAQRVAQSIESESRTAAARAEFRRAALVQLSPNRVVNSARLDDLAEKKRQRWVRDVLSQEGLSRARRFGWIDTYTFTKALGEQLLVKSSNGVPVIILRPSIIESTFSQPEPGWIEGFRMTSPILFGYGRGILQDFPARPEAIIDVIPADFVISALLASLTRAGDGENPKVFQVASGPENPLRWDDLIRYTFDYFQRSPLLTDLGLIVPQPWKYQYPSLDKFHARVGQRRRNLGIAVAICEHLEFWSRATRLTQKLAVNQIHLKRLEYIARLYAEYTRLPFHFETANTRQLFRSLDSADQRDFFFDATAIEWPKYIREVQLEWRVSVVWQFG